MRDKGADEQVPLARYRPKLVYVLSGGAAKGFCHLGMIEALEKRGFMPDLIVGTSAGSIMGALYAHYGSVAAVTKRVEEFIAGEVFRVFEEKYLGPGEMDKEGGSRLKRYFASISETIKNRIHLGRALVTQAMIAEKDATEVFRGLFEGIGFEGLGTAFGAVAVNLCDGVATIFASASLCGGSSPARPVRGADGLAKAVMASCAIPLVFPAVMIDGQPFVDGGIMANLPAREARALLKGDEGFLVGFDVSAPVARTETEFSSVELALRLLALATRSKQDTDRELVDVLFQPLDAEHPWSAFSEYRSFIDMGRAWMTEDRCAAFEKLYWAKCHEMAARDSNPFRRLFAMRRLRRLVGS